MIGRVFASLTACTLLIVSACGGTSSSTGNGSNGGADSCGAVPACGGDIVGTWTASDACVSGEPSSIMMGTCSVGVAVTPHVNGNATFNSNGTYTTSAAISLDETLNIPAACLNQGGVQLTCALVSQLFSQQAGDGGGAASCTNASGGGCTCTLTNQGQATTSAGSYTTSGDSVTTTDPTGANAPSTSSYCVNGSHLHIISNSTTTGADGGATTVTVDIVLSK